MREGPPRSGARSGSRRILELDVLRCCAILLVLGSHPVVKWSRPEDVPLPAEFWQAIGWTGVDLFFVLSGFLIGGLLFSEYRKTGGLNVRRFLLRRGFKIWPSYYFFLLVIGVARLVWERPLGAMLPYAVHVQNYSNSDVAAHCWSLAVEEHFYLALPLLLVWAFGRRRPGLVLWLAAAVAIVCPVMRGLSLASSIPQVETHLRMDSLLAGVALAYCYHFQPAFVKSARRYSALLIGLGIATVLVATAPGGLMQGMPRQLSLALVPTLVYAGYGCCMTGLVCRPGNHASTLEGGPIAPPVNSPGAKSPVHPLARLLAAIGAYSYPIYLWHIDGGYKPARALIDSGALSAHSPWLRWLLGTSVYVLIAVGVGVLMSRCVERPMLMLRDRYFPRTAEPVSTVTMSEDSGTSPVADHVAVGEVAVSAADSADVPK